MTDIIERLTHEIDYAQGILIEDALCAMEDARDEIQRLRGELENVERDRMAQVEVERLRALIAECAEAVKGLNDAGMGEGRVPRFLDAFDALREEANR